MDQQYISERLAPSAAGSPTVAARGGPELHIVCDWQLTFTVGKAEDRVSLSCRGKEVLLGGE